MVFAGEGGNLGEKRTETGLFLCRANDGGTLVGREGSVQPGRSTTKMPGIWDPCRWIMGFVRLS